MFAASEATPFAKTGGLADVAGSLPRALAERGHRCAVVMPLYRSAREAGLAIQGTGVAFTIPMGARPVPGRLARSRLPDSEVDVFLIEQPEYFERDDPALGRGLYQYRTGDGKLKDYVDNAARFIFFSRAVLEALPHVGFLPDIVHCNDWQTGLVPAYLKVGLQQSALGSRPEPGKANSRQPIADSRQPKAVFTIHNLAYRGVFWHWDMALTGLDWGLFNWRQLEFYGHLNLLKAGIVFSDAINAVSPSYAEEIQTREYGCGIEEVLRYYKVKLSGIVNGVDYRVWNPQTDPHLPARYNSETVRQGKAVCKAAVQRDFHLPAQPHVPLAAMISRLVEQKGFSLLKETASALLREEVQLVVLGVGDPVFHRFLSDLADRHPDRVAVRFEFDETLAHRIEAGADVFLMPSRFEPSGLNQLYSLRYGTVPVVRATGGLKDTVTDCTPQTLEAGTATGFVFRDFEAKAMLAALGAALDTYRYLPEIWRQLQWTGMAQDWSWNHSAAAYEALYRSLIDKKREPEESKT